MSALAAHLWQSTWFALMAGLLAWCMGKEPARVRFWIWSVALVKFVVPFAVLSALGQRFVVQVDGDDAFLPLVKQAAAPFIIESFPSVAVSESTWIVIAGVWATGVLFVLSRWFLDWFEVRRIVQRGTFITSRANVPLIASDEVIEPAVFGLKRAVVLLPSRLLDQLPHEQLEAVIAHELQHVRRRDNGLAAIHAVIQALVWFHPLVWWIGQQLMATREQACDEAVVDAGHERSTYAQAIVRVCRHALEARSTCVAHAAGGNLAERLGAIVSQQPVPTSHVLRLALLMGVAIATLAITITSGATVIATSHLSLAAGSHTIRVSTNDGPAFVTATNDFVYARNVSLRELIGHVYSVPASQVQGRVPGLDQPRYDVELSSPEGMHIDHRELVASALDAQFNLEVTAFPALRTNQ